MPAYGAFHTTEELHRSGRVTLWKAAPPAGGGDVAVKVCRLSEWDGQDDEGAGELRAFGEVCEDLGRLGRDGAGHWIPILGTGSDETQVWYATRYFPKSLDTVIEGRIAVDALTLHWIATSIVAGLAEIDRELRRPHGALKPSNVFLDGDGPLRTLRILLSDPKARSRASGVSDHVADIHQLGRLLLQLVRRRRIDASSVVGWPLEGGPEWRLLGAKGDGWRAFIESLLKPAMSPAEADIESVALRLKGLAAPASRPWVAVAALAVPVCAVAVVAGVLRFAPYDSLPAAVRGAAESLGNVPKDLDVVPPEWGLLCAAYDDWLGDFASGLQTKASRWAGDPYLGENVVGVLRAALERNGSFDPRKFDPRIGGSLVDLQTNPPAAVKDGRVVRKVRDDWDAVLKARKAIAGWPVLSEIRRAADTFETLGWNQAAATARNAAASAAGPALHAENIDAARALAADAASVLSIWQGLGQKQSILAGTSDPVLSGLVEGVRLRMAPFAAPKDLARALASESRSLDARVALVQRDWSSAIDSRRFLRESFVKDYHGPADSAALARWDREIADYYAVSAADDPRRGSDLRGRLDSLGPKVDSLEAVERISPAQDGSGARASERFRARILEARARTDALLSRVLLRKDTPAASLELKTIDGEISALEADIAESAARALPDPNAWMSRIAGTTFAPAGSAIEALWEKRRDPLLTEARAIDLHTHLAEYRALRERDRLTEAFFAGLVAPESGVAGLASSRAVAVPGAEGRIRATGHDGGLEELLARIPWDGGAPRVTAADFLASEEAKAVMSRARENAIRFEDFSRDMVEAESRLANGDGLPEVGPLAAKWRVHPPGEGPLPEAVFNQVSDLERIERETAPGPLVELAGSQHIAVALAAWHRLMHEAGWPAAGDLAAAGELASSLRSRVAKSIADPVRSKAIADEIASSRPRWWHSAFLGARDDDQVGALVKLLPDFGIPEETLSPRERFNVNLWHARTNNWRNVAHNQVPQVCRSIATGIEVLDTVAQVKGLPGVLNYPGVQAWLARLRGVRDTSRPPAMLRDPRFPEPIMNEMSWPSNQLAESIVRSQPYIDLQSADPRST